MTLQAFDNKNAEYKILLTPVLLYRNDPKISHHIAPQMTLLHSKEYKKILYRREM